MMELLTSQTINPLLAISFTFTSLRKKNHLVILIVSTDHANPTREYKSMYSITYLDKKANDKGDKERHQSGMGYRDWQT